MFSHNMRLLLELKKKQGGRKIFIKNKQTKIQEALGIQEQIIPSQLPQPPTPYYKEQVPVLLSCPVSLRKKMQIKEKEPNLEFVLTPSDKS